MSKINEAKEILKKYDQNHIISVIDKIEKEKQNQLIKQILSIDFEELKNLYESIYEDIYSISGNIKPVKATNPNLISEKEKQEYIKTGENVVKKNKFAVVTMAGGQGTRLGHPGAKGTYEIELLGKTKSMFEIIIETLKRANEKYNCKIQWYIMTSKENFEETVEFFKKNKYFGYMKKNIKFFKQNEIPFIDEDGKVLINKDYMIKEASNGNGGIFNAMLKNKIIEDLKNKGIEWIFIGSVDNILLKIVDVELIGLTVKEKNLIGTRTILKEYPEEKVGVFCKQNNKIKVIEYTELPKEMAQEINGNDELKFGEAHIMCNLFNIKAIEKVSSKKLKYHIAFKKAEYVDKDGNYIKVQEENAYKFEKFIFDVFGLFENISILRGIRQENFAPVKNAKGVDTPKTAKKLYEKFWKNQNIKLTD